MRDGFVGGDSSQKLELNILQKKMEEELFTIIDDKEKGASFLNTLKEEREADFTLLMFSIMKKNRLAFDMLIKYGASIEAVNSSRANAVQMLAKRGLLFWLETSLTCPEYTPAKVKELLNRQNNKGWTPLHAAVSRDQLSAVKWLLKRGADPNVAMYTGWTPLMHAVKNCNALLTQILLEYGADREKFASHNLYPGASNVFNFPNYFKKYLLSRGLSQEKLKTLEKAKEDNIWMGFSYLSAPHRTFHLVPSKPNRVSAVDVAIQQGCSTVLDLLIRYEAPDPNNIYKDKTPRGGPKKPTGLVINCCCQVKYDILQEEKGNVLKRKLADVEKEEEEARKVPDPDSEQEGEEEEEELDYFDK